MIQSLNYMFKFRTVTFNVHLVRCHTLASPSSFISFRDCCYKGLLSTPFNRFFCISSISRTRGHTAKIVKS